jgi:hypothetical protein
MWFRRKNKQDLLNHSNVKLIKDYYIRSQQNFVKISFDKVKFFDKGDIVLLLKKSFITKAFILSNNGAIAQLGERMTGSHEVRGSIPLSSTSLRFERSEK